MSITNNNLFLFCIGGTGSRVLRALTFLLASGITLNARRVIPIILDPDRENGDLNRTMEILRKYQEIREKLEFTHNGFFGTDIQTLASLEASGQDGTGLSITNDFRYQIDGTRQGKFGDFLEINSMSKANQALVNALFSQENLDADLEVGFKGNPHMGSVVLNQFKDSEEFKFFASRVNRGDRIFIVSSIFGGTGAAGFPLLVKNIRDAKSGIPNNERLKNLPVGAVTVLPYFGVEPDPSIAIDKNTFISKTKAALAYYEQHLSGNNSLNALYYLGDKVTADVKPHEGGRGQANNAHYIEILAALSVIDFLDISDTKTACAGGRALTPLFKEYGLVNSGNQVSLDLTNLGKQTRAKIAKPLSQYCYSVNYWDNHLERAVSNAQKQVFVTDGLAAQFLSSTFFREDLRVFNLRFLQWLEELKASDRHFIPFEAQVKDNFLHNLVNGIVQAKVGPFYGKKVEWGYEEFDASLNRAHKKLPALPAEQKLMSLFYQATASIYDERIQPQMAV